MAYRSFFKTTGPLIKVECLHISLIFNKTKKNINVFILLQNDICYSISLLAELLHSRNTKQKYRKNNKNNNNKKIFKQFLF